MSLKFDTAQAIKIALASEPAANDLITLVNSATGGGANPSVTTLTASGGATIGGNCSVSGDLLLASGKVLKVNTKQVVGAQQAVVAASTITATTGSLPTADGATTIADAATPTVAELLDAIVELKTKFEAVLTALKTHGLIASS